MLTIYSIITPGTTTIIEISMVGRISCKPNNGALLSTSMNKHDDSKSPYYCALLGTRTNSNNDSKSSGAGMDILALILAVIIVTFIVQSVVNVTMIATMVLIKII